MSVRNIVVRFFMMNKRLYKKPFFIITFSLIIAVTLFMSYGVHNDEGIVRISLYAENSGDAVASKIISELQNDKSIIKFSIVDSQEEAYVNVKENRSDAAWIFSADTENKIRDFAKHPDKNNSFIHIVQQENNVFLFLANEKLYSTVYPTMSEYLYNDFMADEYGAKDEKLLKSYYDNAISIDSLIDMTSFNSGKKAETQSYILSPFRGMLAIMLTVCSLSAVLYFLQDKRRGLLNLDKPKNHMLIETGYVLSASANAAVFIMIALFASKMNSASVGRELLLMVLLVAMCVGFAMLLGEIFSGQTLLGALIPGLSLIMLAVCPVFIDINIGTIQYLFPPYYYLNAVYDDSYIVSMLIYTFASFLMCYVIKKMRMHFLK